MKWMVGAALLTLLTVSWATAAAAEPDAVITKDVVRVTIAADGSSTLEEEDVIRIENEAGLERFGKFERMYDPARTDVTVEDASVLESDGTAHPLPAGAIKDQVAPDLKASPYNSFHEVTFAYPRVAPGMSVRFRVKTHQRTPLLAGQTWETSYFQDAAPIKDSTFDVIFPDSMHLNWLGRGRMQGVAPQVQHQDGQTHWVWHIQEASALPSEKGMPSNADIASSVTVSSFSSWDQIVHAYQHSWDQATNPDGVDLTRFLSKVGSGSPEQRFADIVKCVMDGTQEVGVDLPPNQYPPLSLAQTLTAASLTTSDRCVLILGLCRAAGVPASLGLSSTQDTGRIDRAFPCPEPLTRAVVQEEASRHWLVDPSNDAPALGETRPPLVDQTVLLVPSAAWVQTGLPSPAQSREIVRMEARIDKEGTLSEQMRMQQFGAQGSVWRGVLAGTNKDEQMEFMNHLVADISPHAVVSSVYVPSLQPLTASMVEEVRFDVEDSTGHDATMLHLPILPERWLANYLPDTHGTSRQLPLILGFPMVEEKWLHLVLPEGTQVAHLPDNVDKENGLGSYQLTVTTHGREVWALSRLTLTTTRVSPPQYNDFVDLVETALQAEDTSLALSPVRHARE